MKNALISVTNKSLINNLLKTLSKLEYQFFASRGTVKHINSLGYKAKLIEDYTGFPEILGGRVKTLHPKIYGGILAKRNNNEHLEEISKQDIELIDLVCVDLYPFKEVLKNTSNYDVLLENIDIGGVSLIRASAKANIPVLTEASDYEKVISELEETGKVSDELNKYLVFKAFYNTSIYDQNIFKYFHQFINPSLKYGENPHQKASYFNEDKIIKSIVKGSISYNNILDLSVSSELCFALEKYYKFVVVIVKHGSPAGVGVSNTSIDEAFYKAWDTDSISNFGGVMCANIEINNSFFANLKNKFIEVIAAPKFNTDVLEHVKNRKKLKLVELDNNIIFDTKDEFKTALGVNLFQEKDKWWNFDISNFKQASVNDPYNISGLELAWSVVSSAKSNSVVISSGNTILGIGSGSVSRLDASIIALTKAQNLIKTDDLQIDNVIVASDAFFPFSDSIELINKELNVKCVIQPGGSIRDDELIHYCNNNNIAMLFTNTRHFKH